VIATWIRASTIGLAVLTAIVALLVALAWAIVPLDGLALKLDGETFALADVHGPGAALVFVVAVAAVVIGLLATLAMIVFGLGVGAVGLTIGLLATAGSVAFVLAPFALVGWLVWRLAVRARPPSPTVVAAP
jgi:hypothetical protein